MGNILQDLGNLISDPAKQFKNATDGLGITNLLKDVEQGLSGGEGWGGLGKNVAAVAAAPFTGGASLAGSQWADNALAGNDILGKQEEMFPAKKDPYQDVSASIAQPEQPKNPSKDILGTIIDSTQPGGLLSQIEQGVTGGKGVGGLVENAGNVAGAVAPMVGNYLGAQAQADVARRGQDMQAKAYQEMMARSKEGEGQFLDSLGQNPQLEGMKKDLQDMNSQVVGRQQNMINQQLGRAGVKGGQAANLYGRQIGELQQNGMRDVNKLAYEDAANKANQKSTYFANKGQSGFNLVPKYS